MRVMQRCLACGQEFLLEYYDDGSYDYIDDPCDCDSPFEPVDGPSISEWLEARRAVCISRTTAAPGGLDITIESEGQGDCC